MVGNRFPRGPPNVRNIAPPEAPKWAQRASRGPLGDIVGPLWAPHGPVIALRRFKNWPKERKTGKLYASSLTRRRPKARRINLLELLDVLNLLDLLFGFIGFFEFIGFSGKNGRTDGFILGPS